ncbi:MAG: peptidylprolyl isomerase [Gammaproteobacteria bacterium]|nr:peptidylprolyl isomerase [Gammaproteobacteria bacterium]
MLHFIRERAQGWIAWVIVGLLIVPFALWGINEYFGNGGRLVAATVNDTDISEREFQQAFFEQRNRMQKMLGGQYDAQLFDPQLKKRALEELIDRELLRQYAEKTGYRVSTTAVVGTIRSIDAFREEGVFSNDLYQQQVRSQGQSPAAFEARVRRMLLTGQLAEGLAGTALVTEADLKTAVRLQEQKRDFQYLTLAVDGYRDESVADESAMQTYYDEHAAQFMTTEKVRVEYIELSAQKITETMAKESPPSEAELREFFDSHSSQYQVPEERQARHILIQVNEGADADAVEKARIKAQDIWKRITAGESFEDLAKEFSDDPGSAEMGGDLGFFGRGIMEPDFEETVFTMQVGDVSEPVLTSFGYHIIKLAAIRESESQSFEEMRDELLPQYLADAAEKTYFDLAEQLTNLAYETPDNLSETANQLGLTLNQSDFFGRRGGAGLFANPRVSQAAYSDEVLKQGYNSEPIELGENHVVVMRLLDHQEAKQRPLAEVKDQLKAQLVSDHARAQAKQAGLDAVNKLESGESSEQIASALKLKWEIVNAAGREMGSVDRTILGKVFKLKKPEGEASTFGGVVLNNGAFAVIALKAVTEGDLASLDEAARETLKRKLAGEAGANSQAHLLSLLRKTATVTITNTDI